MDTLCSFTNADGTSDAVNLGYDWIGNIARQTIVAK